eukprot:2324505-Pleurochrysis_carterae.AAC.1
MMGVAICDSKVATTSAMHKSEGASSRLYEIKSDVMQANLMSARGIARYRRSGEIMRWEGSSPGEFPTRPSRRRRPAR